MIPLDPQVHVLAHQERTATLRRSFGAAEPRRAQRRVRRTLGRWLIDLGLRLELGRSPDRGMPFPVS
jgi:hypothetical protein